MKFAAKHYVRINGVLYSRGEIIPGEFLNKEQQKWLTQNDAIALVDGDPVDPVMEEPAPVQEDEALEIDVMAGIVTEPEAPAKPKTGGRSRKK